MQDLTPPAPAPFTQCSRASVVLMDKLPCSYGACASAASRRQDSADPLGSPFPRTSGDKNSACASNETFSEGAAEVVAEGVTEGAPEGATDGEDGNAIVWSRVKLAVCGVHVDKVVEKGPLGTTARGSMAISCREVRTSARCLICFDCRPQLPGGRYRKTGVRSLNFEVYAKRVLVHLLLL